MIEETDDIRRATVVLQNSLQDSREGFQKAKASGRLATRSERAENAQLEVTTTPQTSDASARRPSQAESTSATVPADSEVAWRYTRLAITAGLVVLLLVVWIWQKKGGR